MKAHGYSTCHFWSNFEIADMEFWRSKAYEEYFAYLDRAGGFFYERWGDAPVHSIALALFEDKSKIHWYEWSSSRRKTTLCANIYVLNLGSRTSATTMCRTLIVPTVPNAMAASRANSTKAPRSCRKRIVGQAGSSTSVPDDRSDTRNRERGEKGKTFDSEPGRSIERPKHEPSQEKPHIQPFAFLGGF